MRRWLLLPAAALLLAVAGATTWTALRGDALLAGGGSDPVAQKSFSTGVAEGFRLRDFEHLGVDLLSVETLRIEKLRRGGVTLGAFNVLALEGVTVNLTGDPSRARTSPPVTDAASDVTSPLDFIGCLKSVPGLSNKKKFSSVRITRLAVNRLTGGGKERLFTAETAEAGIGAGKALRLKGCLVFDGGDGGVPVHDAQVEIEPEPTLVYSLQGGLKKMLPLQ